MKPITLCIRPAYLGPALAMILLSCVAASVVVEAQVESGKIVGKVRDSSGAVVADADIAATEVETNVEHKTKSDSNGEYVVTALKSGSYTVTAERSGYKKAVQASFKLDVNQVVRVDLTLSVGSVLERVEVRAAEPLVESELLH
jgi:carboxypeptidase family protein